MYTSTLSSIAFWSFVDLLHLHWCDLLSSEAVHHPSSRFPDLHSITCPFLLTPISRNGSYEHLLCLQWPDRSGLTPDSLLSACGSTGVPIFYFIITISPIRCKSLNPIYIYIRKLFIKCAEMHRKSRWFFDSYLSILLINVIIILWDVYAEHSSRNRHM